MLLLLLSSPISIYHCILSISHRFSPESKHTQNKHTPLFFLPPSAFSIPFSLTFSHTPTAQKMSECCSPSTKTSINNQGHHHQSSTLVITVSFLLCSFVLSQPLYFFKLLSFLSPLFVSTALLLLLATLSHHRHHPHHPHPPPHDLSDSKPAFLEIAIRSVVEKLRWEADCEEESEESHRLVRRDFEDLEMYKIVFQVTEESETLICNSDEKTVGIARDVEDYLEEKEICCETVSDCKSQGEEEEEFIEFAESNKLVEEEEEDEKKPLVRSASESVVMNSSTDHTISRVDAIAIDTQKLQNCEENSQKSCTNPGNVVKREREWKRTLACMLFEERHNNGGDGMDSLWETYEAESNNPPQHVQSSRVQIEPRSKIGMKMTNSNSNKKSDVDDDDEDEDEDDEGSEAATATELCCLQALKLSAGKINIRMGMGMRRPSGGIVRMCKALKGVGWLHHHAKKKGYS